LAALVQSAVENLATASPVTSLALTVATLLSAPTAMPASGGDDPDAVVFDEKDAPGLRAPREKPKAPDAPKKKEVEEKKDGERQQQNDEEQMKDEEASKAGVHEINGLERLLREPRGQEFGDGAALWETLGRDEVAGLVWHEALREVIQAERS